MKSENGLDEIRRILIALDASPASQAALELAAELAVRYQAELIGVYVEDINLIRSAELPITQEVGYYSGSSHDIDTPHLERELRAHARRVEQLLASIARKGNLRWSFQRARGVIPGELITAAAGTDLIILGKTGWSGGNKIGSTAREVAVSSPIQSLILLKRVRPGSPTLVLYDGSPAGRKALAAARRISRPQGKLIILILAETKVKAEELQEEVQSAFENIELQLEFRWVTDLRADLLSYLARISSCDVVVLPIKREQFEPEKLIAMLNEAECAVLLVR